MNLRAKTGADREPLATILIRHFGGETVVARGRVFHPLELDGFVAEESGAVFGVLTYAFADAALEVVTLDSFIEDKGAGTALLQAAVEKARALGARRAWLVTTNDNIRALRFYQKRGWDMVALHREAVAASRALKPQIPPLSEDGIAIRHEIEFELRL